MDYRISTAQLAQTGLQGIQKNQATLNDIISQISSGLRNNLDPVEKAQQLSYNVKISNTSQNIRNGATILPNLNDQDVALLSISDSLIQLKDVMIQSQNSATYDKNSMQMALTNIQQTVLSLANTQDSENNYIFSGFQSKTKPFSNINTYNGDQGVNKINIGDSATVNANTPGDSVITQNVMDTFNKFQNFITTNVNDPTMFDSVKQAISDISLQLANVGNNINKINDFSNLNDSLNLQNQTRLSKIQDADIASLATQLSSAQLAAQASLKSYATIQNLSLFNYI
jgi:flagellar hook-associated protein 3 FlgL